MAKRALIVGIDDYENLTKLKGCVADAKAMQELLECNEDGSPNYDCQLLTSDTARIDRKTLRAEWRRLFNNVQGDILFYFAGHGAPTDVGGFLVTQEGDADDPGLSMNDLLVLAAKSKAKHVLLILDCCYSGDTGNPPNLPGDAQLPEGVTVLAASRSTEKARETDGHGVFTRLLLGALKGGAADVRGRVSAASIYAYAEQALGAWEQRPMYKSHADQLPPVRLCHPSVEDPVLRQLPELFPRPDAPYPLDPSYERTHKKAKAKNVARFELFKKLRDARLLTTKNGKDLYYTALKSGHVKLTALGQFYWHLAEQRRI